MFIPIDWLKEYIKTNLTDQHTADTLTLAGLSIDELKNSIMDGEVTANRPDWLSIYGVARELSALTSNKLETIPIKPIQSSNEKNITLDIDQSLIIRYSSYVIKNIKVGESPDWLKKRLSQVNIRSINNIVDITNYVMIETGQPLHSFDLDKIIGPIIIRRGKDGENITTLDDISRPIDKNIIVAENNHQLIDLVGIMGGALSSTENDTKNIILQAAVFPPAIIRRSSKQIKVSTEASYRYERGVDYTKCKDYLDRAAGLIVELCGGQITQLIDIYPKRLPSKNITWNLTQAKKLLGVSIKAAHALEWLNSLGIKTKQDKNDFVSISPSWRFDINIKEDIYEELARFYGINNFPRTQITPQLVDNSETEYNFIEFLKDALFKLGLTEIDGYSFLSRKTLQNLNINPKDCLEASNPLSEEFQYLRPTLKTDMLIAVSQNPSFSPVAFFEIGNTFNKIGERNHLGIIVSGTKKEVDQTKSTVSNWLNIYFDPSKYSIEDISPETLLKFKIRKANAQFLEIEISAFKDTIKSKSYQYILPQLNQKYRILAKYESARRDLSIIVNDTADTDSIRQTILNVDSSIKNVEIFDQFKNPKFGKDNVSLAFHIHYQSDEKTLTEKEISRLHQNVISILKLKFQAIPRI